MSSNTPDIPEGMEDIYINGRRTRVWKEPTPEEMTVKQILEALAFGLEPFGKGNYMSEDVDQALEAINAICRADALKIHDHYNLLLVRQGSEVEDAWNAAAEYSGQALAELKRIAEREDI